MNRRHRHRRTRIIERKWLRGRHRLLPVSRDSQCVASSSRSFVRRTCARRCFGIVSRTHCYHVSIGTTRFTTTGTYRSHANFLIVFQFLNWIATFRNRFKRWQYLFPLEAIVYRFVFRIVTGNFLDRNSLFP